MDNKETIILLVALLLIIGIIYFSQLQVQQNDTDKAKMLFFKSLNVGKNAMNYVYSYEEDSSGFKTRIKLVSYNGVYLANITTPLSEKNLYYLENDTLFCINFKNSSKCASVKNETSLQSYVSSVKAFFTNNTKIEEISSRMRFLSEKNALSFGGTMTEKEINGKNCSEVAFVINYSVLSIADATQAGVVPGMPMEIYGNVCIDQENGQWYEKLFKTFFQGKEITSYSKLLKVDWVNGEPIQLPTVIENTSILGTFGAENQFQSEILDCFAKSGAERDKCVHNNALWEGMPKLCELTGARKDMCNLDMALIKKDKELCMLTGEFKDDCYLELSWKMKNKSYCDLISNATKQSFCIEKIENAAIVIPINATANVTINNTS